MSDTRPFKILYVCASNISRSPLAEAFARHFVSQNGARVPYAVSSAGTQAVDGDAPRTEFLEVASSVGLDLSTHRARTLTKDICAEPDLILAMSWEEIAHIWSLQPEAWPKSFTLREFIHWAKRAEKRPKILFPDQISRMTDRIEQAHAVRKRARADEGFWGGMRPEELDVPEPDAGGTAAWHPLAQRIEALVADAIRLCGGP